MALPPFHPDELTILDACAGFGMLAESAGVYLDSIGIRSRVVCHVERDSAAAAALVARMEGSPLDQALVWDDLATFDGAAWRGCVDIACAGLPCPAYSSAGKRVGTTDPRAWGNWKPGSGLPRLGDDAGPVPHFLRIISECRAAVVFLENVPEFVTAGWFRPIGDELCRLGYTIEDAEFRAAEDVGAPHERERVFIIAVADAECRRRWQHVARWRSDRGSVVGRGSEELPLFPPGRGDIDNPDHPDWWAWAAVAAVDASLMPRVELAIPALVDGMARSDALRIGGNGVAPLAAADAFGVLFDRVMRRIHRGKIA